MDFAAWLRRELDREGLNLSEAGKSFGVSHTTVKRWLDREASPTWDNMQAVAKSLHWDIEDVVAELRRPSYVTSSVNDEIKARLRGLVNEIKWDETNYEPALDILKGYIRRQGPSDKTGTS